jgi:hypothetical protein
MEREIPKRTVIVGYTTYEYFETEHTIGYVEEGKKYSQGEVVIELELANYESLESAQDELMRRAKEMDEERSR